MGDKTLIAEFEKCHIPQYIPQCRNKIDFDSTNIISQKKQ